MEIRFPEFLVSFSPHHTLYFYIKPYYFLYFYAADSNGKFWACFVTLIYGFPISLYRSFSAIRFTFVLGISFVLYYSFVIVYESFQEEKFGSIEENFEQAEKFHLMGILKTLPIAIFSFTCHSNVLEVYKVFIIFLFFLYSL